MEGSNKEEEKKGTDNQNEIQSVNPENQISSITEAETEAKIKEIEAKFSAVKFSMEEKDMLRQIYSENAPGEELNTKIAKLLKEMSE